MTVTHLFDHQVESLVSAVRALVRSDGKDGAALEIVRKQVTEELMNTECLPVVTAALGKLRDEPGAALLEQSVGHHRDTFYLPDRTLSAVVVPVAIRLTSRLDGDVQLSEVHQNYVDYIAREIEREVESRKLVFDRASTSSCLPPICRRDSVSS